jgi:hypothetical protein
MFLFACPIPTPFTENPLRWYSEHWEIASTPAYVEWARPENIKFLTLHLVVGLLASVVAIYGLAKLYISHGAKLKNRQRACLGGVLLLIAVAAFSFFWNGASKVAFPHVSAEAQMVLLQSTFGLALIVPAIPAVAALVLIAGIKKNEISAGSNVA